MSAVKQLQYRSGAKKKQKKNFTSPTLTSSVTKTPRPQPHQSRAPDLPDHLVKLQNSGCERVSTGQPAPRGSQAQRRIFNGVATSVSLLSDKDHRSPALV